MNERRNRSVHIGLFGVGLDVYWGQFPGLKEDLLGYLDVFEQQVQANGVHTTNLGLVDNAQAAYALLPRLQAAHFDLIFCDMLTYATSSTFGILIRELDVPIVLVALQPRSRLDYEHATIYMQLCNDNVCSLPEFAGVAVRMGKRVPPMVIGTLHNDEAVQREIAEWCQIARVLHDLKGARIGHFGHPIEAMLDMHSDPTAFTAAFGLHVVQTEIDDLVRLERTVTEDEVARKEAQILNLFDTPDPQADPLTRKLTPEDLHQSARVAVALDKFVREFDLDGLAYYYKGEPGSATERIAASLIVGNSLLCAAGFPMCGESDLKTCVAMLIMDRLGMGGSFAEFHPLDFDEGFILVGHDGPHHIGIAEGRPRLRSLTRYHGKPGSGASVEFQIKAGPITMLCLTSTYDGRFKLVIAEGESVCGAIPATGNTNTRAFFKPDAVTFLKRWLAEGPTHHLALGVGHRAQTLKTIGDILGIESATVNQTSIV
ncbi:MAG: L-fucose/L-arabinose isomerase family protein [Anaerolineae bacterium]|nr:L-fucose/L-arabinose isomerase family protein [Anaerolineae bacterium]